MAKPDLPTDDNYDVSLALGGPLYQALRRVRLVEPPLGLVARRMAAIAALVWLPLLVLNLLAGTALPGRVALPFLHDLAVNVRFLLVAPLFIYAELPVHERTRRILRTFLDRELITSKTLESFRGSIAFLMRLRNSAVLEIGLLLFVFTLGGRLSESSLAEETSNWWLKEGGGFTTAGWWYFHISLPIVQFLLLRWLFRLLLWSFLMWRVSRLELALIPTHPDRAGGLGFLAEISVAFSPVLCGMSALVAGVSGNRILFGHETLDSMKIEIGSFVVFMLLLALVPLCVFAPQLAAAKRRGKAAYGALAARYTREFDQKWMQGSVPADEPLLGSADIQSLADLNGGYEIIASMRPVPFGLDLALSLAVPIVVPLLPLVLSVIPLDELLKKALGALF